VERALPEDLSTIWQRVRDEVRSSLPASTYRLWVEPLRPVSARGATLYLTGPERVRTWVERRYAPRLEAALRAHSAALREVAFVSPEDTGTPTDPGASRHPALAPNPGHTFERFVIGNSNRLAHGAALAVAELPGESYNPLFLHGAPGLGKTHLLGAIAHYLACHHPELTVRYTTGEQFTSEFVSALRGSGVQGFKERHRAIDVLLIDDVQFLQDKSRTEEEFFHTFDALHDTGSQIVLASDRAPYALSRLAERLRDRFEWGLSVEIAAPDLPTRIAVLGRLASEASVPIPSPDALREIAAHVPTNLRRLEGALTRVVAVASITSREPTAQLAREALERTSGKPLERREPAAGQDQPSIAAIQEAVCAVMGLTRQDLLSPSRSPRITRARHLAMYMARELSGLSLAQIAREFDRDHSTVLHAVRRVGGQLEPGSPMHRNLTAARTLLDTGQASS
jgi:chromosomal replication initiator protein